jgi:hypothetical protein
MVEEKEKSSTAPEIKKGGAANPKGKKKKGRK